MRHLAECAELHPVAKLAVPVPWLTAPRAAENTADMLQSVDVNTLGVLMAKEAVVEVMGATLTQEQWMRVLFLEFTAAVILTLDQRLRQRSLLLRMLISTATISAP